MDRLTVCLVSLWSFNLILMGKLSIMDWSAENIEASIKMKNLNNTSLLESEGGRVLQPNKTSTLSCVNDAFDSCANGVHVDNNDDGRDHTCIFFLYFFGFFF